jgi:cation transport regulator ChaC
MNKDSQLIAEAYLKTLKENAEVPVTDSKLNVQPGDWGDSYQEVKNIIDQLLSYGIDKSVLAGVLQYAEEVGYTGESVDNLIKLIQHFNSKGVQDS